MTGSSRPTQRRRVGHAKGLSLQDALAAPPVPAPAPRRRPRYSADEIAARSGRQRTVFGQALHVLGTLDPLVDSDDEADDAARYSYDIKLSVLRDFAEPKYGHKRGLGHAPDHPSVSATWHAPSDTHLSPISSRRDDPAGRDAFERQSSVPYTYGERRSSLSEHHSRRRPSMDYGQGSSYEYYSAHHSHVHEPRSHFAHHDHPVFSYDQPVHARRRPSYPDTRVYDRRSSIGSAHDGAPAYPLPVRRPSLTS